MVRISSALRILIMRILVPVRTEHARRAMTRNIKVKTWTSGDLLVSVITFCVGFMSGEAAVVTVTMVGVTEESSEKD
jgi:hypothetical protein